MRRTNQLRPPTKRPSLLLVMLFVVAGIVILQSTCEFHSTSIHTPGHHQVSVIAYIFSWNERKMLKLNMEHLSQLVDEIIVLDNESTDGSEEEVEKFREIQSMRKRTGLSSVKVSFRIQSTNGTHPATSAHLQFRREGWKEAKGKHDWAIIMDTDEFLVWDVCSQETFRQFLARNNDKNVIVPAGYQMLFNPLDRVLGEDVVDVEEEEIEQGNANEKWNELRADEALRSGVPIRLPEIAMIGLRSGKMYSKSSSLSKPVVLKTASNKTLPLGVGGHYFLDDSILPQEVLYMDELPTDNPPLKTLHFGLATGSLAYRWRRYQEILPRKSIDGRLPPKHPSLVKYQSKSNLISKRKLVRSQAEFIPGVSRSFCNSPPTSLASSRPL